MKVSKKDETVNRDILEQFEDQRSRGTQGFGAIFIDDKGSMKLKRATGEVLSVIDLYLTKASTILFHHRSPSSSRNKISQTHPIHITSGDLKSDYYFMHNGVISNSDERKETHEKLGYVYSTDVETPDFHGVMESMYNDTEALGYDVARFIEGQTKHIKSVGSAAFFMLQVSKETAIVEKIFFGRNEGNPLNMAKSAGEIMLSSEGKGEEIKVDTLYSFDPKTEKMKLTKKEMIIPRYTKIEGTYSGARGIGYNTDDDDDFGNYSRSTRSAYPRSESIMYPREDALTEEVDSICDDFEEEATKPLTEFFENLKQIDKQNMFKLDVSEVLKKIAQCMMVAQEECQKAWSATMVDEMDRELKDRIDEEADAKDILEKEKTIIPDKLSAK